MPPLSLESSSISKMSKADVRNVNEIDIDCADAFNNNLKENVVIKKCDPNQYGKVPCVVVDTVSGQKIRYLYNTRGSEIVWRNVLLFFILHTVYIFGYYVCFANKCWYTWIFSKFIYKYVLTFIFLYNIRKVIFKCDI